MMQYTQDYDELYPRRSIDGNSWRRLMQPYTKSAQLFACPSNPNNANNASAANSEFPAIPVSYAASCTTDNGSYQENSTNPLKAGGIGVVGCSIPIPVSLVEKPAQTIAIVESVSGTDEYNIVASLGSNKFDYSGRHLFAGHLGTSNFLFADGHVKSYAPLRTVNEATSNPTQENLWTRNNSNFTSSNFTNARGNLSYSNETYN